MTETPRSPEDARRSLAGPVRLTRLGMAAERATHAFWPFVAVLLAGIAAPMLGLHELLPLELVWGLGVAIVLGLGWTLVHGVRQFRWPGAAEAEARLDATLPGRPIAALRDVQAIGAGDAASEAVWRAHLRRMAERTMGARAVEPDLRVSDRDPYALRYMALVFFVIALLFGSVWRAATVTELAAGPGPAVAAGPAWEGWIEPPAYTGKPSLYLNDIDQAQLEISEGSRVTLRLYGEPGALSLTESVSGRDAAAQLEPAQSFEVTRAGRISIEGTGGQAWDIQLIEDSSPQIEFTGQIERGAAGDLRQPFRAWDDYGVVAGEAQITLDMAALDRSFGLAAEPEPREPISFDLPMTITGDRSDFEETLIENISEHPWVGLPVTLTFSAVDALGQTGAVTTQVAELPGRRFFDPMARAVVEQRRDLLWNRENATRVAQVLRAVSFEPEGLIPSATLYLRLRYAIRRIEAGAAHEFSDARLEEVSAALWEIAVMLEDGTLSDALERLRRAQDRLSEAMREGASDEEIAELMQELRDAMQDYMRQLAEQQQQEGEQQQAEGPQGEMQEITGDQLQEMLDQLQQLMEEGRMAEAEQLLEQLRQMMENMQVTQGQQGNQGQNPGNEAMQGLQDTLRDQQGLSDEAFRDLQEQFNPGAQSGQSQQNEGFSGGQGRGQEHDGQGGEGQAGEPDADSLANRQQALRDQLDRQRQNLPGAGTPEGDAARESLGRAGEAMDEAEDALRQDDLAGALDSQSEAIEALREGMRNLGEAMAREQQQGQGQQGEQLGNADPDSRRDPLGRNAGTDGQIGTDENLLQGEDVYRRARELLDEIRRRSGDQTRPDAELDYLRRLLDRF